MLRSFVKKCIPPQLLSFRAKLRSRFFSWLVRNAALRRFNGALVKALARVNPDGVIRFYSRNNLARTGSILKDYYAQIVFHAIIDPQVRKDLSKFSQFQNLLFKDAAATRWSKGIEASDDFYLKDGRSSCLTPIIEQILRSDRNDWKLIDLGCGTGNCNRILADQLKGRFKAVDGIDFSSNAIEYARSRFEPGSGHQFIARDLREWLREMPVNQNWLYDIAYSHLVLQLFDGEYVADVFRLLKEKKVARTLYISDSYCDRSMDLSTAAETIYNPVGYLRFDHYHPKFFEPGGL